jgi:hypothetical protein
MTGTARRWKYLPYPGLGICLAGKASGLASQSISGEKQVRPYKRKQEELLPPVSKLNCL